MPFIYSSTWLLAFHLPVCAVGKKRKLRTMTNVVAIGKNALKENVFIKKVSNIILCNLKICRRGYNSFNKSVNLNNPSLSLSPMASRARRDAPHTSAKNNGHEWPGRKLQTISAPSAQHLWTRNAGEKTKCRAIGCLARRNESIINWQIMFFHV